MSVYMVCGAANQDENDLLYWSAWCLTDWDLEGSPSDCTIQLYLLNGDGTRTTVTGATETVATPDADGVFNGSFTIALLSGRLYAAKVVMTVAAATRTGVFTLGVPVRAN